MTLTCTDACCINNLINGKAVDAVAAANHRRFCVEGIIQDEVIQNREELERLIRSGLVQEFLGDNVKASEVGDVAAKHNIGLGEAECIAIGKKAGANVASDDSRARRAATNELGERRVTGTLGLLREAVARKTMTPSQAFESYRRMVEKGGYLPKVDDESFFIRVA
jgi:predicted nucleic acid-binding protein